MKEREMMQQFMRLQEQVQIMTGERGGADKSRTFIRRGELRPLAGLSTQMKSKQITAAPTAADYNALQADVAAIYQAFVLISNTLGNAKIPTI